MMLVFMLRQHYKYDQVDHARQCIIDTAAKDPDELMKFGFEGLAPIHLIIRDGPLEHLHLLLEKCPETLNLPTQIIKPEAESEITPMEYAIRKMNNKAFVYMLTYKESSVQVGRPKNLDKILATFAKHPDEQTSFRAVCFDVFRFFVEHNILDRCYYMVDSGILKVTDTDPLTGHTMLHRLAKYGRGDADYQALKAYLLKQGVDPEHRDVFGFTVDSIEFASKIYRWDNEARARDHRTASTGSSGGVSAGSGSDGSSETISSGSSSTEDTGAASKTSAASLFKSAPAKASKDQSKSSDRTPAENKKPGVPLHP